MKNQEETFNAASEGMPGARIVVRPDGTFTFYTRTSLDARRVINYMSSHGFTFDNVAIGDSANFAADKSTSKQPQVR